MDTVRLLYVRLLSSGPVTGSGLERQYASSRIGGLHKILFAFSFLPFAAGAQASGAFEGVVRTAEGSPVGQAKIVITGSPLAATSDSNGNFRIAFAPLGNQTVEIKRLGYTTVRLPVTIVFEKPARLEVVLGAVAAELPRVTVSADANVSPAIQGFLDRKGRGNGFFFTRDQISRMQARFFTDILRRVPGLQLQLLTETTDNSYTVRMRRTTVGIEGRQECPVLYYMNGVPFPMASDAAINNFISADDVAAVEVYSGASQIPPQFNSSSFNARCGVIVIWTLNGMETRSGH